jgi:hypothetical protein
MKKEVIVSIIIGAIVSLLTGLINTTPSKLVGVGYWGFPIKWVKQIIYPGAPKEILWIHFIENTIIWIAMIFVIVIIIRQIAKRSM